MSKEADKYFRKWSENCRIFTDYKPLHSHEDMMQFAEDYHTEQLRLHNVSQRSELLAFRKWQKDNWKDVYLYSNEFMIREFKKANCG